MKVEYHIRHLHRHAPFTVYGKYSGEGATGEFTVGEFQSYNMAETIRGALNQAYDFGHTQGRLEEAIAAGAQIKQLHDAVMNGKSIPR